MINHTIETEAFQFPTKFGCDSLDLLNLLEIVTNNVDCTIVVQNVGISGENFILHTCNNNFGKIRHFTKSTFYSPPIFCIEILFYAKNTTATFKYSSKERLNDFKNRKNGHYS